MKPVELLSIADLEAHPVWQFSDSDTGSETLVTPVDSLPVSDLSGRIVGTEVSLNSGARVWGLLGNVNLKRPEMNKHFLSISVYRDGRWFLMARYHDSDVAKRGPEAVAKFLGMELGDVFPISYDISAICVGDAISWVGSIEAVPPERLSRAQIIALALP